MTTIAITQHIACTNFAIQKPTPCDASPDSPLDLGDILTALILADDDLYQQILVAREQARQGYFLTHEEVFGTD